VSGSQSQKLFNTAAPIAIAVEGGRIALVRRDGARGEGVIRSPGGETLASFRTTWRPIALALSASFVAVMTQRPGRPVRKRIEYFDSRGRRRGSVGISRLAEGLALFDRWVAFKVYRDIKVFDLKKAIISDYSHPRGAEPVRL
jgi:hypothetical protein